MPYPSKQRAQVHATCLVVFMTVKRTLPGLKRMSYRICICPRLNMCREADVRYRCCLHDHRAFVVFNRPTYPNFMRLLTVLGVEASDSDMSWSFSAAKPMSRSRYEWASRGLLSFFVQRSNWFRPRHWRLFWDILRFSSTAKRAIQCGDMTDESIEEFMLSHDFGDAFREDYMIVCCLSFVMCVIVS